MYYTIRVRVQRPNKKGDLKAVNETYVTDVETFAEAEQKALTHFQNDCEVIAVSQQPAWREIFNKKEEDKPFFKAKLIDSFLDDEGNEKQLVYYALVCAENVPQATDLTLKQLKQGYGDITLDSIIKTNIVDLLR